MNDRVFSLTTRIARPAAEVFAWHERPGALVRLCPPWEHVELVSATGGVRDGAQVTVRNKVGPCWTEWRVEHRDYVAGSQFRDVQLSGPFEKWEHLHRLQPDGPAACTLTDEIHYRLPGGVAGKLLAGEMVRRRLARVFAWRHATTKADLESVARYGAIAPRRVVIAGASGMIGRALEAFLLTQGHRVCRLVRRPACGEAEVSWNPAAGELDAEAIEGTDVVINLSGEDIGAGRWTAARRERIRRSRLDATRTLVATIAKLACKPTVFVSASAIGFYGECGDAIVTEASASGRGFLPEVCLAWETQAAAAERLGVRTALLRFGVVLTPAGGALAKLLPFFRAGLGGRVGAGTQWISWISIEDAVGAIYHAMVDARCDGPLNAVAPEPVSNAEFARALARVVRRPAVLPMPAMAVKVMFGEMADATLLVSTRAVPERLLATGYEFRHSTLASALSHVMGVSVYRTQS